MIGTRAHAAIMAVQMASVAFAEDDQIRFFEDQFLPHAEEFFDEVVTHRLSAESFCLHQQGKGIFPQSPWADVPADMKLAFTLFCAAVPILAALIEQPAAAEPAAPAGQFESIIDEDDGDGTIFDKEKFGSGVSQAGPETGTEAPPETQELSGTDGSGSAVEGESLSTGAADQSTVVGTDDGTAATQADAADVTANTDPAAEVMPDKPVILAKPDQEPRHEGGDVVDDDAEDAEEGGDVEGDDDAPAVTETRKTRRAKN